jgi:hypothetical protein
MSFPISPSNGAQTTVNGITYTYRASTRSWLRVQAALSDISVTGNLTAGNLSLTNTGDVSANIGAYQLYANANIGTLFLGNVSTQANIGAFYAYANTKIGSNSDGNLVVAATTASTNTTTGALVVAGGAGVAGTINVGGNVTAGNVISSVYYSAGGAAKFELTDIGLVALDVAGQQFKFGAGGIEASPGIFGGSYGGNKLSLNNETALISNRYDTVTIQTGTDGSAQNTWTFGNSALTAPGRITASGNIIANSGVASTSNVTGALVVRGGVGVAGNVFANTIYTTTGIRWAGNGVAFSSGGGGGGASALDDLTDVIITSPTTSQVLKYNGTNWINAADATGGGGGSGITYTSDPTSPAFPNIGDQWYDTDTDILYEYIEDGVSSYWVDIQSPIFSSGITNGVVGNVSITGPTTSSGHLTVSRTATITGNIITLANINVSNSANVLGNLTVGGNVAFSRSATIAANLTVTGNISSGNVTTANIRATGNITTTGDIAATTVSSANVTVTSNVTTANVSATDISSTGNITSGNIATGNLTVTSNIISTELTTSGNTTAGNLSATGNVTFTGANVYVGNVANVSIGGGSSGQYLQTNGAGDLTWQTLPVTNIQEFTATASQTTFTVIGTYTVGSVLVFVNGIQMNSVDYTATSGTTVVLAEPRNVGDTVRVIASFGSASLVSGLTLNVTNLQNFSVAMSVALGM